MAPGTECARTFCAGIGPLQLGGVLVPILLFVSITRKSQSMSIQYRFFLVFQLVEILIVWSIHSSIKVIALICKR